MRARILIISCSVALAMAPLAAPRAASEWTAANPSPVVRLEGATAVIGDELYAFGGFDSALVSQHASHAFNPATGQWRPLADMPRAVSHVQAAVVATRAYLAGGFEGISGGPPLQIVQVYDTITNQWHLDAVPAMPAARASGGFVAVGTRLHYLGGLMPDRCTDTTEHRVFDIAAPQLGWRDLAPLPEAKNHFQAVVLDGRIYATGGQDGHDCGGPLLASAHVYDPDTDQWHAIAPLPAARSHHEPSSFAWNGRIVVAGGIDNAAPAIASVVAYDPARDRWQRWPDLPVARRSPIVQRIGTRVLFGTGGALPSGITATADFQVNTVRADAPRVLFVRGADRSGGFLEATDDTARTEHLADIDDLGNAAGNHGWGELAGTLASEGFALEQIAESPEPGSGPSEGEPAPLHVIGLGDYAAIVFGSNNASYGAGAIAAVRAFIAAGGGALFVSDANFGGSWRDAPDSDQAFLAPFGLRMNQDNGTYVPRRSEGDFLAPVHPVLEGIEAFDGEGVSPISVDTAVAGVTTTVVVRAEDTVRVNVPPFGAQEQGGTRAVAAGDGTLLLAETAGGGRIAGHFDRNTFFNAGGAGTDITRFDNRAYAVNLFDWLAQGSADPALFRDGFE